MSNNTIYGFILVFIVSLCMIGLVNTVTNSAEMDRAGLKACFKLGTVYWEHSCN